MGVGHLPAPLPRGPPITLLHSAQGCTKAGRGRLRAPPSPGLLASLGSAPCPLPQTGQGRARGCPPGGCFPGPRACGGGVAWRDDGRPGDRARFWAARAAHSPALMPAPRAHRRPRRCGPWPGPGVAMPRGGGARREAGGAGRKAGGARWPGAPAGAGGWRGWEGAAVRVCAQPSRARPTAAPRPPRARAAGTCSPSRLRRPPATDRHGVGGAQGLRQPSLRHKNTQTHTQRQQPSDTHTQSHTQR